MLTDEPRSAADFGIEDSDLYDPSMLHALQHYDVAGLRPAMVTGTRYPLHGSIKCIVDRGSCSVAFTYSGLPEVIRIIAVSRAGEVVVARHAIERKVFHTEVRFDFANGEAIETTKSVYRPGLFLVTLFATLLIEGVVLMSFGFSVRSSWKPFLAINLCTQGFLTAALIYVMYFHGPSAASMFFVLAELTIAMIEAPLFAWALREHTVRRRVAYALVANAASCLVGIAVA